MGRYSSPDEHAFFPERLPVSVVPLKEYKSPVCLNNVNINDQILAFYRERIVPQIAEGGDDLQHSSTTASDIAVLQHLSRRIHYGKFVAESRFLSEREHFDLLIKMQDANGIRTA